jgi:hypothetical protein
MAKPFNTRDFDGMTPGLMHPEKSDPADGKRALEKFVDLLNVKTGTATIALGDDDVVIAVGLEYDGQPVFVSLNTVDATLTTLLTAAWDAAGNLTITGDANATADATVSYRVEG